MSEKSCNSNETENQLSQSHLSETGTVNVKQQQNNHLVYYAIIICFATLPYIGCLNGPFVFDDHVAIRTNKDVIDNNVTIQQILTHDFWGENIEKNVSHKSYRPVTTLTFRFNVWLHGINNMHGFHLFNILLNVLATLSTYVMLKQVSVIIRSHNNANNDENYDAFVSTLVFAVHSVHTENVCGIVGRADILCFLFYSLSIISFVQITTVLSSENTSTKTQSFTNLTAAFKALVLTLCGELCHILAIFSKELGITIFIIKLVIFIINEVINSYFNKKINWQKRVMCILSLLVSFIVMISLAVFRMFINNWRLYEFAKEDNPHNYVARTDLYVINKLYLWMIHAFLLLCPVWLCFDWSMSCVPVIQSLVDYRVCIVLSGLFLVICILLSLVKQLKEIYRKYHKRILNLNATVDFLKFINICFWLLWILITFLPSSGILFSIGFVIAERVLFLPSLGYCVLLVQCCKHMLPKHKTRIVLAVVALLSLKSYMRSCDWNNEALLYQSGVYVCPNNAKVFYNIGKLTADSGNSNYAKQAYFKAIKLENNYEQALNNLGNLVRMKGNLHKSEELLERAVKSNSKFASAWMNLGITRMELRKFEEAENAYRKALEIRKHYPACRHNLAQLFYLAGRHSEALLEWERALDEKATIRQAWEGLINVYSALNNIAMVEKSAQKALDLFPGSVHIFRALAKAYGNSEDRKALAEGVKILEYLRVQLPKTGPDLLHDLAVLYHRLQERKSAYNMYKEAELQLTESEFAGSEWDSLRNNLKTNLRGLNYKPRVSSQEK